MSWVFNPTTRQRYILNSATCDLVATVEGDSSELWRCTALSFSPPTPTPCDYHTHIHIQQVVTGQLARLFSLCCCYGLRTQRLSCDCLKIFISAYNVSFFSPCRFKRPTLKKATVFNRRFLTTRRAIYLHLYF